MIIPLFPCFPEFWEPCRCIARIHVIEFQKLGYHHAHILLTVRHEEKPQDAEDVDSAEIRNKEELA